MNKRSDILKRLYCVQILLCVWLSLCVHMRLAGQTDTLAVEQSDSLNVAGTDSLGVSILTCAPGDILYTLYGHTAIRVQIFNADTLAMLPKDIVFNYGAFDYNADKFVYRFLKGETDYIIAAEPAERFFAEYQNEKKARVWEQVLNLSHDEKARLFEFLRYNCAPENRMYRYNWLYNNCTNRAKEVIDACVDGKVEYRASKKELTAREILHRYTKVDSWIKFGVDFILGQEIDRELTQAQQMFIPDIYSNELDSAVIVASDGSERKMVLDRAVPVNLERKDREDKCNMPMIVFGVIFVGLAICSFKEWERKKTYKWIDVTLSAIVGLVGCLITFFFFFSEHPGFDTNWWVIIFNPIPLAFIPSIIKRRTKYACRIALFGFVVGIIVMLLTHQNSLTLEFVVLALILLMRILVNLYLNGKNKLV